MSGSTEGFDPLALLRALDAHGVRFVVIGGVAGALWGSPSATFDLDVCHARDAENRDHLAAALGDLHARLRGVAEDVPFVLDAETLRLGDSFTFSTAAGDLDVLGTPQGTRGFEDLASRAVRVEVGDGVEALVVTIDDLIRMKRAAARGKDQAELPILEALREELDAETGGTP